MQTDHKRRHRLKLRHLPAGAAGHARVGLVEGSEFCLRFDHREEHAKLPAPQLVEESLEGVVVVEKVLARPVAGRFERPLQIFEERIQLLQDQRAGARRLHAGDSVKDLQPPFDMPLQFQRSEYLSHSLFTDAVVAAVEEPAADL